MLVIEPSDRSVWQRWFAWRPVRAAVINDPRGEVIPHSLSTNGERLCFLRFVSRRKTGQDWEYAVFGRPETPDEWANRTSW